MRHVFLDTNVIVDLLADRKPFSAHAIALFRLSETGKVRLYGSTHSFATVHYLMKKLVEEKRLRGLMTDLLDFVTLVPVTEDAVRQALRSSFPDFEDALQIKTAGQMTAIDLIVTRNLKHFKESSIQVLAPEMAVQQIVG